jgi:hypothetical protein
VGDFGVGGGIVDEAEATDFSDEEGDCEDGHDGDCLEGLLDFQAHLVLEIFGVLECGLVEDKDVAEGCEGGVDESAEEPGKWLAFHVHRRRAWTRRNSPCKNVQAHGLPPNVVPIPSALICVLTRLDAKVLACRLELPCAFQDIDALCGAVEGCGVFEALEAGGECADGVEGGE